MEHDEEVERVSAKQVKVEGENSPNGSMEATFLDIHVGETGRRHSQAMLDLAIVNFICAAAIPPTIVDYTEWKRIFMITNNWYHPKSSDIVVDDHIPGQAARARELSLKYLCTQFDLTISYDGATTKKPQSVYTIHFTTPDGHCFLIEGQESSDESHTGQHIADQLLSAMDIVGRERFSRISGDSTGNTKLAWSIVYDVVTTLINMPDVCHHTSLACKDICWLPIFADVWWHCLDLLYLYAHESIYKVIKVLRTTITLFSKSTFALTMLTKQHKIDHITWGLEKIGKTQFTTICLSAIPLDRCIPAIMKLVTQGTIKIKVRWITQLLCVIFNMMIMIVTGQGRQPNVHWT